MKILCSPSTKDIEEYLQNNINFGEKILHIVPTKILERRRRLFYREHLQKYDQNFFHFNYFDLSEGEQSKLFKKHGVYIFELNTFFDNLLIDFEITHLTNREASIYIERALKKIEHLNNKPWLDMIPGILSFFTLIKIGEINKKNIEPKVNIETWDTLKEIFVAYEDLLNQDNVIDKADAYLVALKKLISENYNHIYIDGAFLPFPPLLNQLLKVFPKEKISFFIPYDLDKKHNLKFKVLEDTYSNLLPIKYWENIKNRKRFDRRVNLIHSVADSLFENKKVKITDPSLVINKFISSEEEIKNVVDEISFSLKKGYLDSKKVAIVSTEPMQLRKQVNEFLEIKGIQTSKIEKQLIDYPIGKVIFILYQIYIDERVGLFTDKNHYFDYTMLGDFLHVIEVSQDTNYYDTFNKLNAFLTDCITFEDWYNRLIELKKAKRIKTLTRYKEHPLNFVTEEDLIKLKELIIFIEKLSTHLIKQESKSFVDHLSYLFNLIKTNKYINNMFLNSDIVILEEKINEFVISQLKSENIPITSIEFGNRIHSILTDVRDLDEVDDPNLSNIIVTGPNNIEYQEYDQIYLIQFSQNKFPEKHQYTWPMNEEFELLILNNCTNTYRVSTESMLEYYSYRSLYYFFIVLNSAVKELKITYSNVYDSNPASPSHYLFDIARLLIPENYHKILSSSDDIENKLEKELAKIQILKDASGLSKKAVYPELNSNLFIKEGSIINVEEAVAFEQCPRHYYYLKKYRELNFINDGFQLFHYAVASMYEKVVQVFVRENKSIEIYNKSIHNVLKDNFNNYFHKAREEIGFLFLLNQKEWEDIEVRVKNLFYRLIDLIFNIKGSITSIDFEWQEKHEQVEISDITVKIKKDLLVKYSNGSTRNYYVSDCKDPFIDRNKYIKLQNGLTMNDEQSKNNLKSTHAKISEQHFPKTPNKSCKYCKYKYMCLRNEVSY